MPLSGGMGAKSATKKINNDARRGGCEGGGGEVNNNNKLSHGNGHHHLTWDPFQSFGLVSFVYWTWLKGCNVRTMQCAWQRRMQALVQIEDIIVGGK